jgi:hypothetical protein
MSSRDVLQRRRADDPLSIFLKYLSEIEQTLINRNWTQLATLLRKRRSSHLPREVREELVLLSRSPRTSFRAPVRFLRFQHRMLQLALAGEPMPMVQTELELEPPATPHDVRRIDDGKRRVAASERRAGNRPGGDEA